ncbi:Carboxylesterase [Lasiodiplodia theobromae]|nr:Carboxylesterase [Lasiodiplodia theobromae]
MADVDRIRKALDNQPFGFTPSYDGRTDMRSIEDAISQGTAAKVPILIGTNADEGSVLTSAMPPPQLILEGIFGNDTAAMAAARAAYPANATDEKLKSRILTDYGYTCTTSAIANTAVQAGYSVWRYYFDASFPNTQPFPGAGAWHTSEISLVFGTYPRNNQTTAQQIRLSRFLQLSWADFAKDPYGGPGWASVGGAGEDLEVIGVNGTAWGESVEEQTVDEICRVYTAAVQKNGL